MTDAERAELAQLEAWTSKPRDFAGDLVTVEDRRKLSRLYWLRLRAAGVSTWKEAMDQIAGRAIR